LSGTPDDGFHIRVIDHDNMVRDGDHASFPITLDGGMQGSPEADKCIALAFLP